MPVIELSLSKLTKYCKNVQSEADLLNSLPYLGLDIEEQIGDFVRVEYSPNRPDFSSQTGIARALAGLLGVETGPPKYNFPRSEFKVNVSGNEIKLVRPHVYGLYAEISVSDDLIKELITMQEDLHNGIGRKRAKVAIGIHNAEVISKNIKYHAVQSSDFSFVPLGESRQMTIEVILNETAQGKSYGKLLSKSYPILEDSNGNVLSMPPIINGELTRLKAGISKLFVDITGTDESSIITSTAIIASMLSDAGAKVYSVEIKQSGGSIWTPDMSDRTMHFDLGLTNEITGVDFNFQEAEKALGRSRIGLRANSEAIIPKYRHDIIHQIDLVEEVALGYGIQKFDPLDFRTSLTGSLDPRLSNEDRMIDVLVGLGLTEVWNLSLTSRDQVTVCEVSSLLKVEDTKSKSYEYLRCELMPSLLGVLGGSVHQEYPQKVFEIAPIFKKSNTAINGVKEEEHVAVALADSFVNYSSIKSVVESFLRNTLRDGVKIEYRSAAEALSVFAKGRTAEVVIANATSETTIGHVGEVAPDSLERYHIKVPVAAFEIRLDPLLKD